MALIRDDLFRQATIKAVGDTTVLKLGRKPFTILLQNGGIGEMMKLHVKEKYNIRAKVQA